MVVVSQSQAEQGAVVFQNNSSGGNNRRQLFRLWCTPGKGSGSKILVSGGSQTDLESDGATGSAEGAKGLPAKNKGTAPSSKVRQCGRCRIHKQAGGTRSPALQMIAGEIFAWAESNLASLTAVHLKGTLNSLADFLSRQQVKQDEWSLNQEVLEQVVKTWGIPEVDLFASESNKKVAQFFSLHSLDRARGMDAFANAWHFNLCYAFPPVRLVAEALQKILTQEMDLILIAPFWPRKAWFAVLKRLAIYPPILLPMREDLVTQGPI